MNAQTFEFAQPRPPLEFRPMLAGDAMLLSLQPSQQFELGLDHKSYSLEEGEDLAENGLAWTAYRGARSSRSPASARSFPATRSCGPRCPTGSAPIIWRSPALPAGRSPTRPIAGSRRLSTPTTRARSPGRSWSGSRLVHELRGYGREGKTHILFERISEDTPCK
jgi:hypothetical protein